MATDTATAAAAKKKATRQRKPTNFALGWVTETANETDEEGNEISGSSRICIVLVDLPPGLDEAGKRSRDAIERAVKRAVYDQGLEEYGNKRLRVIQFGEDFDVPFEKTTVTRLLPPDKAEKVKSENGKGAVVTTEETEETEEADGTEG